MIGKFQNLNKNKGFTLVELLLVMVLISTISGAVLSVVNTTGMRAKARDAQRKSDISKIRSALELYYTDNRAYPISPSGDWIDIVDGTSVLESAPFTTYLDVLPSDPSYNTAQASPCTLDPDTDGDKDYRYNYRTSPTGGIYMLTAIMEISSSDDESKCSSLNNWTRATCGAAGNATCGCTSGDSYTGTEDFCYGVQNPL